MFVFDTWSSHLLYWLILSKSHHQSGCCECYCTNESIPDEKWSCKRRCMSRWYSGWILLFCCHCTWKSTQMANLFHWWWSVSKYIYVSSTVLFLYWLAGFFFWCGYNFDTFDDKYNYSIIVLDTYNLNFFCFNLMMDCNYSIIVFLIPIIWYFCWWSITIALSFLDTCNLIVEELNKIESAVVPQFGHSVV